MSTAMDVEYALMAPEVLGHGNTTKRALEPLFPRSLLSHETLI